MCLFLCWRHLKSFSFSPKMAVRLILWRTTGPRVRASRLLLALFICYFLVGRSWAGPLQLPVREWKDRSGPSSVGWVLVTGAGASSVLLSLSLSLACSCWHIPLTWTSSMRVTDGHIFFYTIPSDPSTLMRERKTWSPLDPCGIGFIAPRPCVFLL